MGRAGGDGCALSALLRRRHRDEAYSGAGARGGAGRARYVARLAEKIDPTWLAYALSEQAEPAALAAGIERVRDHYDTLIDYPTQVDSVLGPRLGVVVIADAEPRSQWPHFTEGNGLAVATAYVPTGWQRIAGESGPSEAALPLGRALAANPALAADTLAAPFLIAVIEPDAGRLLVLNDAIGAARLYELRLGAMRIWSNRAAAPLLFAGIEPRADERGWRILAAASWLIGDATPFAGVRKVGPGTVIEVAPSGVREQATDAVGPLVSPERASAAALAEAACADAVTQARDAGAAWPATADCDLSGGRDSRVVAAAVIAAGVDVRLNTSDATPGEADVARRLVELAPRPIEHRLRKTDDSAAKQHERPLLARALNVHLLHDGMRHPQKLRGKQDLPKSRPANATFSGHGGEIAHGFFYKDRRSLLRIRLGGEDAVRARLARMFAKDHGAARDDAYAEADAEVERILAEGRRLGVKGPALLEWFYLVDRFANRSGIGAHAERVSIFGTPAFIRASFSLSPGQRLSARLHTRMVERLVPAWTEVPYFKAERAPIRTVRRLRIWEAPEDAAAIERLISSDGPWSELYRPERVREMWAKLRAGEGKGSWEAVFEGIAYRAAFDEYLAMLRERSAAGPALAAP